MEEMKLPIIYRFRFDLRGQIPQVSKNTYEIKQVVHKRAGKLVLDEVAVKACLDGSPFLYKEGRPFSLEKELNHVRPSGGSWFVLLDSDDEEAAANLVRAALRKNAAAYDEKLAKVEHELRNLASI